MSHFMKTRMTFLIVLLVTLSFVIPSNSVAAMVWVTDCTKYGPGIGTLQDAIYGVPDDRHIRFSCEGTIIVPEIVIDKFVFFNPAYRNVTLSGNHQNRLFVVKPGGSLRLDLMKLVDGYTPYLAGGAISVEGGNLYIFGGSIKGSVAAAKSQGGGTGGGAIYLNGGRAEIYGATFSGNGALGTSGCGALAVSGGTATIFDSTFSGNVAVGAGGAICNFGGKVSILDSTLTANVTRDGGGAIVNFGEMEIYTSTIVGNSALTRGKGGGIWSLIASPLTIHNSIVALNLLGGNCSIQGTIAGGYNLTTDTTCPWPVFRRVSPLSLRLGRPTGSPAYFPLLPGSVAIDAGNPISDYCVPPPQNGGNRPAGNACDVGAYEFQP